MKIDYNKNCLDVFRLIGTVQVFLGHAITHFAMENPPHDAVYFVRGVPILFVLCGFLAAKALDKYDAKYWLVRRAQRILPAFWVCILVNSLIIALLYTTKPTVMEAAVYGLTQFLGLNFYTGGWLREYGVGTPNGVLWTIPVQIQFFVLAPVLRNVLKEKGIRTSAVCILALALLSILIERCGGVLPQMVYKLLGVTVIPYLYFLVAGMAAWYHRDRIIPALREKKWLVLTAYCVWKVAEMKLQLPGIVNGVMYNTVTTLLTAAVIFAFGFAFTWRMSRDYTFGFYLYHMVWVNIAIELGYVEWNFVVIGFIVLLTLASAWLSMHLVEEPCGRFLKKRG